MPQLLVFKKRHRCSSHAGRVKRQLFWKIRNSVNYYSDSGWLGSGCVTSTVPKYGHEGEGRAITWENSALLGEY